MEFKDAIMEIDDVHTAAKMLVDLKGCEPEAKVICLAQWVSRIRETYVRIGRELGRDDR